ncbi:outer mitochondrial transmembrane helix translocase-like isoform X2 [Rhopilema esculentum]
MPSTRISNTQIATACGEMLLFVVVGYYALKFIVNALDPTNKQKTEAKKLAEKLMKSIGVKDIELNDYEMVIAANLIDPLSMSVAWDCIGGLSDVVREMKDNVVLPFKKKEMFSKSVLLSPPKGILLYGPPGCGKTLIAKATAKEADCRFLNLDISSLTDKWYGESQKLANAVFSLAYKIQPCIIFIDEIDSFLRSRSSSDHEATAMMKAQFMSLWDGLSSNPKSNIIIMGATNRPNDVDRAILRRMPCRFYVAMPNKEQRLEILRIILNGEKVDVNVDFEELAEMTKGCSGSDINEFCRLAALNCIRSVTENTKQTT